MPRSVAASVCLGILPVALSGLLGSCVTMKPVKPARELQPVAIGDGKGSARTTVDAGLSPQVELHWDGRGALMVRPLINEIDVGWFVLDTGASGMLISRKAAGEAGLLGLGTTRLQDGSDTTVFIGESFQLGPLTLNGTKYAGVDIPHSSRVFGKKAVGICGFDLLAQTVFELDASGKAIRIYDPATYSLPDAATWQPLELHISLPHAWCEFEGDHRGLFVLDAGYGDSVAFFDNAVEQFDLLADRKTRGRWILNFGSSTKVREGPLDWFQLGQTRIEDIQGAHFATQPVRIYLGPDDVMGLVGMKLMSRFRVVFDYSNNRIAFVPAVVATSAVPPASATPPASAHPIDGARRAVR